MVASLFKLLSSRIVFIHLMSSPSDPDELAVSGTRERGVTVTEVDAGDELANFMGNIRNISVLCKD